MKIKLNPPKVWRIKLITLAFVLAVATPVQQASAYYKIIDLGTLGGYYSEAYSINNNGQIVGVAPDSSGKQRAVLFDPTGGGHNIDLGTLGGTVSEALSINDLGQIVGWALNRSGNQRATLFDPTGGGKNINLGTLPGGGSSWASSINNLDQIVGEAYDGSGNERATLFDQTGGGNNISLSPRVGISNAYSINGNGQIVGRAGGKTALFDPTGGGNNTNLGTLGGVQSGALSINNHRQIVGWAWDRPGSPKATLFDPTWRRKQYRPWHLGRKMERCFINQ